MLFVTYVWLVVLVGIWLLAIIIIAEKMSLTWGQSAWAFLKSVGSSDTTREASSSSLSQSSSPPVGNLNKEHSDITFEQWFVGVTDGDGTFHFSEHMKGKWIFYFKVSQSTYNLRMLYHIKRMLGVGEVRNAEEGMAEFRFRDTKLLLQHIIPLFDQNRLLTSKYYHYNLFKQALLIEKQ